MDNSNEGLKCGIIAQQMDSLMSCQRVSSHLRKDARTTRRSTLFELCWLFPGSVEIDVVVIEAVGVGSCLNAVSRCVLFRHQLSSCSSLCPITRWIIVLCVNSTREWCGGRRTHPW